VANCLPPLNASYSCNNNADFHVSDTMPLYEAKLTRGTRLIMKTRHARTSPVLAGWPTSYILGISD
jgi:hypothetical protein